MVKKKSYAVHEKELEEFLRNIEIYDDILEEKIKCVSCNDIITLENLQSVFPVRDEIKVSCSKLVCFQKALEIKQGWKK